VSRLPELRLHLDADTSIRALERALLSRGHDVTRTPTVWMPVDAEDEAQLLGATGQGRCLFTFNIRDFMALAAKHPRHAGVLLAAQRSWRLPELIAALDGFLREATEMAGRVEWLNRWRE
jgi:uncharacterized protein DUF5615